MQNYSWIRRGKIIDGIYALKIKFHPRTGHGGPEGKVEV
jgi:hypothetical protein